jgi:hypothetical protein
MKASESRDRSAAKIPLDSKTAKRGVLNRVLGELDRLRDIPAPTPLQILSKLWPSPESYAVDAQPQLLARYGKSGASLCRSQFERNGQQVPFVSRRASPSERIESSDRKMITSVTEQERMKKGKQNPPPEPIPVVNEEEFTEVVRRMVNTGPMTREDVEQKGFRRKKNPETDPRKIRLFNLDGMRGNKKS